MGRAGASGPEASAGARDGVSGAAARRSTARFSSAISTAGARSGSGPTSGAGVDEAIDDIGHVPLPPYIKREDALSDRERYQTVYARERGSVAAPTAGLHFTPEILDALDARGVERAAITLHVGYGTFQPVRVEQVEAHTVDAGALLDQRGGRRRDQSRQAREAPQSLRSARRRRGRSRRRRERAAASSRRSRAGPTCSSTRASRSASSTR